MASALQWVPETLYNTSISAIVAIYAKSRKEIKTLHENVQFDIYYKLYKQGRLCSLGMELCELDVFGKLLKVNDKRHLLHHCLQASMDHGMKISRVLADSYSQHCTIASYSDQQAKDNAIQLGFSLGGFLCDAGWFLDCEQVMSSCLQLCRIEDDPQYWKKALESCLRLLHVRYAFCKFSEAEQTYSEANYFVKKLLDCGQKPNLAALYAEFSSLFFVKSHYDEAYKWSIEALKELNNSLPVKIVIDVLRQSAKACVVKRDFRRAELLIKQAVCLARDHFGIQHPKYSDALSDYGFYLLNVDSIVQSVKVYQTALDVRLSVFGGNNLHVAIAHEDLAYASYVHEYSSGRFSEAKDHAEKAMYIMTRILPDDHLLLASSKRVKALILEEIAIDNNDKFTGERLLLEAQELHISALNLARQAFGEMNVQTAKHYGNLGRLYQSMHRFEEAEEMHLRAITIKEKLLGPEDYEVALSVGHLASLYNYDMDKYKEAEQLYLRSITIAKKLFGDGYSGLEYDYRGLLRVHNVLGNQAQVTEYTMILHRWKQLRDSNSDSDISPLQIKEQMQTTTDIIAEFFQMPTTMIFLPSLETDTSK